MLQQSLKDAEKGFCSQPMTVCLFGAGGARTIPAHPTLRDHPGFWEAASHRRCLCRFAVGEFQWCQQASAVFSLAASEHHAIYGAFCLVCHWRWLHSIDTVASLKLCRGDFCSALPAFYFDDAHITARQSCKGSGQRAMQELNRLLGTPLSAEKCQKMQPTGTFLCLDHDFTEVATACSIRFWARERIQEKLVMLMDAASHTDKAFSWSCSQDLWHCQLLRNGCLGAHWRGGLAPIKQRQQERSSELTDAIRASFQLLFAIIQTKPSRCLEVLPYSGPRFLAAFWCSLGGTQAGHRRFLDCLAWQWVAEAWSLCIIDPALCLRYLGPWWQEDCSAGTPPGALRALHKTQQISRPARSLVYRQHCSVDGPCSWPFRQGGFRAHVSPDPSHTLCAQSLIWIPSKANWSHEISRDGLHARWHVNQGFSTHFAIFPFEIWSLPSPAFIRVVEFLYKRFGE